MKKILLLITIIILFPQTIYALEYPKLNSEIVEIYDIIINHQSRL